MKTTIPGNPYALIENNYVRHVVFMQDSTAEEIQEALSKFTYDKYVIASEYGTEIYVGMEEINGEFRFTSPYPSWVWNSKEKFWEAPIPAPDNAVYNWSESELKWVWCNCNVNNGTVEV
jgi:hypothetical protein